MVEKCKVVATGGHFCHFEQVELVHRAIATLPPVDVTSPAKLKAVVAAVVEDMVSTVEVADSTGSSPTMESYLMQASTHGGAGLDSSLIVAAATLESLLLSPPTFFFTPDKSTTREVAMTGSSVGLDAVLEVEELSHFDELVSPVFEGSGVSVA
jgi:hypothetical protein